MSKNLKTALRISVLILIALIIGINLYSLNAARLAGNLIPMPFGVGASVVLSGSMEPELSVGDLILIAESEKYDVGDVVVYQSGGIAVVHKIVSIDGEEVTTKGTANNTNDEPISLDAIKGKVTGSIPLVGYAVNAIKSPIGIIITIVLAIWLLERSFHKEKEQASKELDEIRKQIEELKKG